MYESVLLRRLKIGVLSGVFVLGVYIAFAIAPFLLFSTEFFKEADSLTRFFGAMLFDSFSYMAVGIPLYFIFAAVLLMRHSVSLRLIVAWTSSIIPFLCIALSAKQIIVQGDYVQASLFFFIAVVSTILWLLLIRVVPPCTSFQGVDGAKKQKNRVLLLPERVHLDEGSFDDNPGFGEHSVDAQVFEQEYDDAANADPFDTNPATETSINTGAPEQLTTIYANSAEHSDDAFTYERPGDGGFKHNTYGGKQRQHAEQVIRKDALYKKNTVVQRGAALTSNPGDTADMNEAIATHAAVSGENTETSITDGPSNTRSSEDEKNRNNHARSMSTVRERHRQDDASSYIIPTTGILQFGSYHDEQDNKKSAQNSAERLIETLQEFEIPAEVVDIQSGSTITRFEVLPARGIRLGKIGSISDNIALRLAAERVRIVAPIPGKEAVGIEIPNKQRETVHFGDLIERSDAFWGASMRIPIILGESITGEECVIDLTRTPHMLIAGATGSGKSVCVNTLICSILYRCAPDTVKLILIDPKIVELNFYNDIPHLLTPVVTNANKAYQILQYCLCEMEKRYYKLEGCGVRDIESYNQAMEEEDKYAEKLAYIVIIIDEFADLMMTSGKEIEALVSRLTAMSRAVGIHLVLATQRPSTDVITGLIKANVPSRIAFMVSSKVDSRIIIDTGGAESLLGRGDMLFSSSWNPAPDRIQGSFLSEDEVRRIVTEVKHYGQPDYIDDEIFMDDIPTLDGEYSEEDPLLKDAINLVLQLQKASTSFLQRKFKIGYNRAARLIEAMEEQGIVGPLHGSKPRAVLTGEMKS